MKKAKGYILHETNEHVAIATLESKNSKTGNMAQVWILVKSLSPIEAVHYGKDAIVCGDCPHRPANNGTCYVNIGHGPTAVWNAYRRGTYKPLDGQYECFHGYTVRFGAYGDPALIPWRMLGSIAQNCSGFTGYTHLWRTLHPAYQQFLMASCDSTVEQFLARIQGWRTFRVMPINSNIPLPSEILCPAESKGTQCINCKLCAGTSRMAKNIAITAHGKSAKRFGV